MAGPGFEPGIPTILVVESPNFYIPPSLNHLSLESLKLLPWQWFNCQFQGFVKAPKFNRKWAYWSIENIWLEFDSNPEPLQLYQWTTISTVHIAPPTLIYKVTGYLPFTTNTLIKVSINLTLEQNQWYIF